MHPVKESKILVVEDDRQMCQSIRDLLELHGFGVHTRHHLAGALDALDLAAYDLVLLDIELDDQYGFTVMDRLREKKLDTRVIIITGCYSERFAITALKKGAIDYLKKPVEPDELIQSVNTVLGRQQRMRELGLFKRIVAASPEAIAIADQNGRIIFTNMAYQQMLAPLSAEVERPTMRRHGERESEVPIVDRQIQKTLATGESWSGQIDMIDTAGHRFVAWKRVDPLPQVLGGNLYGIAMIHAMAARPNTDDLKDSLDQIKCLFGMLSICAGCKKIRTDSGGWTDIETFIEAHTNVEFSHGICPDCTRELYPELQRKQ
jgi:DNA-binding response OmpR family regulator